MNVNIHSIAFTPRQGLKELIYGKVKKLQHLFYRIISIEILLKLNNSEKKVNKVCRIRLVIPGYDMLAVAQFSTFEAVTAVAIEALERQIEKRKTRFISKRLINSNFLFIEKAY